MFRVGQKVVCVDGGNWHPWTLMHTNNLPIEKQVYTVREIICYHGKDYVRLAEIVLPSTCHSVCGEGAWAAFRFRPVIERKTSIEVFKKLLNPTPEKVLEYQRGFHVENSEQKRGLFVEGERT